MLGRGLESLIPNKNNNGNQEVASSSAARTRNDKEGEAIFQLEVDKITVNPFQPRRDFDLVALQELAASIREYGILQPLLVSKKEKETDHGTEVEYELIAGERRLQASKLLHMKTVPAIVRSVPQEREKLEMAIIENVQRENLTPIEAARAYAKLQETFGLTQREIAVKVGKSRETIANVVRLLNLPSAVQDALVKNQISESQARMLLAVTDNSQQEQLFNDITKNNLSVRDLKNRIARMRTKKTNEESRIKNQESGISHQPNLIDSELADIQWALEEKIGFPVQIEKHPVTGNLSIIFSSSEDLQALLKNLLN